MYVVILWSVIALVVTRTNSCIKDTHRARYVPQSQSPCSPSVVMEVIRHAELIV